MSVEAKGLQYMEMKVQTATPEALVSMLYEGAIRFLNRAAYGLDQKDWQEAHSNIVRAQNIVTELNISLNKQRGGDIADNLARIYDYLNNRLIEANIKKDAHSVNECINLLSDLNTAWHEVARNVKGKSSAGVSLAG